MKVNQSHRLYICTTTVSGIMLNKHTERDKTMTQKKLDDGKQGKPEVRGRVRTNLRSDWLNCSKWFPWQTASNQSFQMGTIAKEHKVRYMTHTHTYTQAEYIVLAGLKHQQ